MSVLEPRCPNSGQLLEEACGRYISVAVERPSLDCGGVNVLHICLLK